jgi:hypothetical protein
MSEQEDYTDDKGAVLDPYPWPVLAGLAFPYAAVAFGWWVADLAAAGRQDDAWWDTAGNWVYVGVAAAVLVAAWLCLPVLRRIRHPGQLVLAIISALIYFAILTLFNLYVYTRTSGPFP